MRVRTLQLDIVWADVERNIERAERMMEESEKADLYVLPEMWATGFAIEPGGIAEEEEQSEALRWMQEKAASTGSAICGSLAVRVGDGTYRNRHYFVKPDGMSYYDKHHLFTHGHEDIYYQNGSDPVIAEWQGMRFLLQTCYDLRFPCFSRYGKAGLYDAIIYVANWPASRMQAWEILTRARAIENQSYVVAANRSGDDPTTHYAGGSCIVDPLGRYLAQESDTTEIDLCTLEQMRQRFKVLADRDDI